MQPLNPTIVMAAGKGSRMRAASNVDDAVLAEARSRPKAMIRIGSGQKPLLEHLLRQLEGEGCRHACVVIAEDDELTRSHFRAADLGALRLSFAEQGIPPGRSKPMGTAHAVQLALEAHPEWSGTSVTVANGDNLPPKGMFRALFAHASALPAFHPDHLGLPEERIQAFAVIHIDEGGKTTGITEKPDAEMVMRAAWPDGASRVSMNYFRMPHSSLLAAVVDAPEHPLRGEKELPVAISRWIASGGSVKALPMAGSFLDLTHPEDIVRAGTIVDMGGFELDC